jgi:F-type H+-transporting ATPase subunit delta
MSLAVSSRYARALADAAFAEGATVDPDTVLAELRSFLKALESSRPLRDVLASPAVAFAAKRAVIDKLSAQMDLAAITRNFLLVICRHGRLGLLAAVAEAFQAVIDQRRGIAPAEVTIAVEPDAEQRAKFQEAVAAITGKKPRVDYRVDPAILGGAVLRIGSSVYDGSVAGQLRRIGAKLAAGA